MVFQTVLLKDASGIKGCFRIPSGFQRATIRLLLCTDMYRWGCFWIYGQGCQIRRWGSLMRLGLVLNIVRWCIWNRILSSSCQIWWVGGILERSKFELLDTLCNYPDIWGNKYFFVYPKAPIALWILAPKSHYLARKAEKPTLNAPKWGYLA